MIVRRACGSTACRRSCRSPGRWRPSPPRQHQRGAGAGGGARLPVGAVGLQVPAGVRSAAAWIAHRPGQRGRTGPAPRVTGVLPEQAGHARQGSLHRAARHPGDRHRGMKPGGVPARFTRRPAGRRACAPRAGMLRGSARSGHAVWKGWKRHHIHRRVARAIALKTSVAVIDVRGMADLRRMAIIIDDAEARLFPPCPALRDSGDRARTEAEA